MQPEVCYSQSALVRRGRALARDVDVVSFDMFDTLLVRRTHNPDLVKLPVARYVSSLARAAGHDWDWRQVQEKRDQLEQAMRARTGERYADHEARYPDYMADTLHAIFGDAADEALLARVTDYEMAMENTMLVPRREIVAWLQELAAAGKRVFVLSDIYLPAAHLGRLLGHAGILEHVEKVISSADSFLAKASGLAYPHVAENEGIDTSRWLHVGDNAISDGFRPVEHGIRSLLIQDAEEHRRRAIAARHYFYSLRRPFWRGRAIQQLMAPLEAENVPRSALYREGYNFLGPIIAMYIHYVAERCREKGISKLFFLSREGWMFKQVWEKTMPVLYPDGKLPTIEYLYVSRQALAGASCAHEGMTQAKADIVFLPAGNRCFRDVCRVFSLDPDSMTPHLARHGLDLDSVLSPAHEGFHVDHRRAFETLIRDPGYQEAVKSQSRRANEALQRYLESLGFFDQQDVALVDVGWLGTIQRFLHGAIAHRADRPNLHGMLLGASHGIPYPTSPDNAIEGFIFDRERFDFAASAILYARDLFEEACRAPYPTLNAYEPGEDGGHRLVFRTMDDDIGKGEQAQDRFYADLQQGVLDAAGRFGGASGIITQGTAGYRPWINYLLVSKLAFPRRREIRNIRHLHHLDDFHGSSKPRRRRRPKLLHNPWEVAGWKQVVGCLTAGRQFRRHLKAMINH
jgi:FMN phosphatase YigB (HAD superfamily)